MKVKIEINSIWNYWRFLVKRFRSGVSIGKKTLPISRKKHIPNSLAYTEKLEELFMRGSRFTF